MSRFCVVGIPSHDMQPFKIPVWICFADHIVYIISGACIDKYEQCPRLTIQDICAGEMCSQDQYLCHPAVSFLPFNTPPSILVLPTQGCVPLISSCNGACPTLPNTHGRRHRNLSTMGHKLLGSTQLTEVTQSPARLDRRILCGNSCLTKDEARNKYHCGGVCQVPVQHIVTTGYHFNCQVKSEPCHSAGEHACPQHFELCGEDACIDR